MDDTPQPVPEPAKRSRPRQSDEERKAKRRIYEAQRKAEAEDRAVRAEMGLPAPRKGPTTKAHISREIRLQVLEALTRVGGVDYLVRQAKKPNPTPFLALLGKCLIQEDGTGDQNVTFVVQTVNVQAAPVAGVINSPISGHVAPPRLVAQGGDIVDMEEAAPAPAQERHG